VLPLRAGKQTVDEGGIRVPQIIVLPGVTPAGSVSHALTCSTDFSPTLIDLLGWEFSQAPDFDGVCLCPVLEGVGQARDEILCHFPHSAQPYREPRPGTSCFRPGTKMASFCST